MMQGKRWWFNLCLFVVALALASMPAEAGIIKRAATVLALHQGGKAAVKFIAKNAEKRTAKKAAHLATNRQNGKMREKITEDALRKEHPNASVQREQYLRDVEGKVAKDGLTNQGRRVDHVVVEEGQVTRKVETTGLKTSKDAQIAKERRILESGGRYVRDRETGNLIDAGSKTSEIIRRE